MTIAKKLWCLLTPRHHRAAIVLIGLMLIGMVLETLGIGLIIPVLSLMSQGDLVMKYPALAPWLNDFGNPAMSSWS